MEISWSDPNATESFALAIAKQADSEDTLELAREFLGKERSPEANPDPQS